MVRIFMLGIRGWLESKKTSLQESAQELLGLWFGVTICLGIPTLIVSLFVGLGKILEVIFGDPLGRLPVYFSFIVLVPLFVAVSMVLGVFGMVMIYSILMIRDTVKRGIKRRSPPFIVQSDPDQPVDSPWVRNTAWKRIKRNTGVGILLSALIVLFIIIYEEILGRRLPTVEVSKYGDAPVIVFPIMGAVKAVIPEAGVLNDAVFLLLFGIPAIWFGVAARNLMFVGKVEFSDERELHQGERQRFLSFVVIYGLLTVHALAVIWFAATVFRPS